MSTLSPASQVAMAAVASAGGPPGEISRSGGSPREFSRAEPIPPGPSVAARAANGYTLLSNAVASMSRDGSIENEGAMKSVPARRRDYDMCIAFPYKAPEESSTGQKVNGDLKEEMMKHERESILKNLQNCGLHVHCFYSRDRDEIFCKIGANARKLRDTAARMKYRLQLKDEYLSGYAEYRNDFPGRPELHFQDRRMVNHIYKTHSLDDYPSEDAIFSTRDKILIVHHIIASKDRDCAGINVGHLLHNNDLVAYFPLHEDTQLKELASNKLAWVWMGTTHTMAVRDYFGEKVTLYYLFMAYYWKALLIPAGVSMIIQPIEWFYNTPDNISAVPFCIFISVWSVLLPHFWKRQEAKYSVQWGTLELVPEMEPCRPQFYGPMQINPVTNQVEPHYPWAKRVCQYFVSYTIIVVSGVALMLCAILFLVLRHMSQEWALPENMREHRILIFQVGLAVLVEIINSLLDKVAKVLNDWENHRTATEYDKHKLIKVMLFKFVNCFFVLYYVAFFKEKLNLFGMECIQNDCLVDLEYQLAAFVLVRITLSNAAEYLFPRLVATLRACSEKRKAYIHNMSNYSKLEMADMSAAEKQAKKEPYNSFDEFDDTLLAHGYATLFAASAPWVCAATLLWVMVEQVIDVKGLCEARRRPMPVQVANNQPWDTAFEMYGIIAAATNISLLVFASKQYIGNSIAERFFLWVYLAHIVLFFKMLVTVLLPEMPRSVETMRMKQEQQAHRCLENIHLEPEQDFSMTRQQKSAGTKVYEQDHHDIDAEDADPSLQMKRSAEGFTTGVFDSMPLLVVLLFLASGTLGIVTAILIRVADIPV